MSQSAEKIHGEFRIADFHANPQANTLTRGNKIHHLRPKLMELLAYLARNAGSVVDKESIMRDVWEGVFVTSEVLANAICTLRELFGDNARQPRFIETIPKRGYRLIVPVSFTEPPRAVAAVRRLTVGHEKELAELRQCFASALEGHGLLVCVSGEAGIGKTTFLEGFLAEDRVQHCLVGRGKCSERLEGTGAYLPILEMLESLTGEGSDAGLVQLLRRTAPGWYAQVFPNASDAMSLAAQTAGASQERMKRELTAFFREVSDIRPVLLFLDDLHWADASSVDVLAYLCDRCSSMRMLILAAFRPEFLLLASHVFLGVKLSLQTHGVCHEIRLNFLSREEVALYLEKAFPGHQFPRGFAESIYLRTEGNPLFTVDLLAHLRDQGVIVREAASSRWHLSRSLPATECGIPASVQSLIELKLRLLDDHSRRLLECAGIQGHEFDAAVVSRALGAGPAATEERLARMDRVHGLVRLIRPVQPTDRTSTLRYQFVHVLYQNVVSEALSPSRKTSLSAAVAQALLEVYGTENAVVASQVASLFAAARDPLPAAGYYLAAARHALEVSADREAVALARHGLNMLENVGDSTRRARLELFLQMILGTALIRLYGYADPGVKDAHSRAYTLCRDSEDNIEIYRALMGLGAYHIFRCELEAGRGIWDRISRLATASRTPLLLLWSHTTGSIILSHIGDQTAALEHARRGIDAYDPGDHAAIVSFGGFDAGVIGRAQAARILWLCGYPDEASRRVDEALALARRHGHPYTLGLTLFFAGWTSRFLRDASGTTERAAEARSIAEEYGFLMLQGWSEGLLGWGLACQGRLDEGFGRLAEGLRILRSIGCRLICVEFMALLAEVQARRGEARAAAAMLEEALANAHDGGELYYEAELHRTRAQILLRHELKSNPAEVEYLLRKSLDIARRQGSKSFELRAATALSWHYLNAGRAGDAERTLSGIYGWFREGLNTPDLRDATEALNACRQAITDSRPHESSRRQLRGTSPDARNARMRETSG